MTDIPDDPTQPAAKRVLLWPGARVRELEEQVAFLERQLEEAWARVEEVAESARLGVGLKLGSEVARVLLGDRDARVSVMSMPDGKGFDAGYHLDVCIGPRRPKPAAKDAEGSGDQ